MGANIRYGIVGTGMMGVEHLNNLAALRAKNLPLEVTALADTFPPSLIHATDVVSKLGLPPCTVFEDHREMLKAGVCDVVLVSTPNHTHLSILLDIFAFSSQLHVLVEKPLCTTVEDCLRVADAARDREGLLWVGLEYQYMPPVARLIEEVCMKQTIGKLRMVKITEHRFPFLKKVNDWNRLAKNSGDTLVEKCCHFFDLFNLINRGFKPVRLVASAAQSVNHLDEVYDGHRSDILDNAYVIVEYSNGVRACLDLSMFADATHSQEEIAALGDRGKVEAFLPQSTLRVGIRGVHSIGNVQEEHVRDDSGYSGHHFGSSLRENAVFLDHVRAARAGRRDARELSCVSVERGILSVAMGVAAQLSVAEGRWVYMAEVLQSARDHDFRYMYSGRGADARVNAHRPVSV